MDKVGLAPLPTFGDEPTVTALGGRNLAVSRFSGNVPAAKEFVRWVSTSPQVQRLLAQRYSRAPTMASVYDELAEDPVLARLGEVLPNAEPRPPIPEWAAISEEIQQQIRAFWTDDIALSTRIHPQVAVAMGQVELARVVQEGLDAHQRGDRGRATARLGRARTRPAGGQRECAGSARTALRPRDRDLPAGPGGDGAGSGVDENGAGAPQIEVRQPMPSCPSHHESQWSDYCDLCGAPMAEASSSGFAPGACPVCSEDREGRFCEQCGYDFDAHRPASATRVQSGPPA